MVGPRQRDAHAALEVWAQLVDLERRDARLEHLLQGLGARELRLLGHTRQPSDLDALALRLCVVVDGLLDGTCVLVCS